MDNAGAFGGISDELSEPLTFPADAYISEEYARAEGDRLWAKIWQHAGRIEEIPHVGDYITYEIGTDSILIVRASADRIKAFHNVCPHRGRRLVDSPRSGNGACGAKQRFICNYHGWTFSPDGKNTYLLDKDDWQGALNDERTNLNEVRVDTWGGWIWINMDKDCASLREFLEPAASLLDPFEFDKMRYRFRMWGVFDCNWKVALEAFMEPYHVAGTHPQLLKYGDFYAWSKVQGLHGNDGFDARDQSSSGAADQTTVSRTGKGADARLTIAQMQKEFWDTVGASTTETLVNAAARLADELPEGTPPSDVHHYWFDSARRDDAARGVIWPTISDKQMADAGLAWHIFPNFSMIPGVTFALYYRADLMVDPHKCIYEAIAIERFPDGQEPKTEWVHAEQESDQWPMVIAQDISNMVAVQQGLRSRGFNGNLPNPYQERKVTNLHRNLARYMGAGAPQPLTD